MLDLASHWLAERLVYLGRSLTAEEVWRQNVSRTFPRLKLDPKVDVSRWAKHRLLASADANFSHRDLVLYFRHQLRVKIRCDRKRLDCVTFDNRWVNVATLVVMVERGQCWSHLSLLRLLMASTVRVFQVNFFLGFAFRFIVFRGFSSHSHHITFIINKS